MQTLIIIPTTGELDLFLQACAAAHIHTQAERIGRLTVTRLPELEATVASGGLGKMQLGMQTQHLLDTIPNLGAAICAIAAGRGAGLPGLHQPVNCLVAGDLGGYSEDACQTHYVQIRRAQPRGAAHPVC